MASDSSFLFSGIRFNRKKFGVDIARFQKKESDTDSTKISSVAEDESAKSREAVEEKTTSTKKRKRKGNSSGIHILRDAIFRKQHNIHVSGYNVPSPLQSFDELKSRYNCPSYLLRNLKELGFKLPTPIQRQAIPVLLDGRECFACAPTGSGKTLAFVCPMFMKLKLMTKNLLRNADFSKFPCDIISTPLRLRLAIKKKKIDLSRVEYLVLDESDKLFEPELFKQIDSVLKAFSNPSIIRSLFCATLPDFVEDRARELMHDAVRVIVGRNLNPPVLVFLQSKERAKELYGELAFDNIRVDVIHSDLSQQERENAVDNFRAGKTWVLIATDVVARGMDFKGVNCVINYDFPDSASAYVHRIGRSGRAGRTGEAITFYTEEDIPFLRNVANLMAASGCEVPSWLMELQKKKWKKHRPKRDSISTKPETA
ncbi:hypothetical protein PHAVU_001G175300 [Phaseolus vulgaris]|uniref:RNA helicase n=1 Tax=Phaseolus vulgaris TaxID=3885 RepID=V7D0P1_PHAVU|nr:hypothetical protein PHAVU_001G175300g [Phaseolus vulgaris]ESW34721.1 hypothetical protein PHAVU_001G175300g [Phaseolus vulgaris]